MEEPITFENENGDKLFGIVHVPEKSMFGNKRVGINLLNPGIKYRVAPNRLNVKIARKLCEKGYYVLRFDPKGIGDSEGELPDNVLVADIWEKIEMGLLVEDTITANDVFVMNYKINELILAGNCGGAMTSLLTAEKDARVNGLVLIDIPIDLRTAKSTFADKAAVGGKKAEWLFFEYVKRIFRLESWIRFVSLQSDYRALWAVIKMKLKKTFSKFENNKTTFGSTEVLCEQHGLNRLFFRAFESFIKSHKPILFILAGNDKGTEIFQNYFEKIYLKKNSFYNRFIKIHLIENANHIYTMYEWQQSLINQLLLWISDESPVR